MEVFKERKVIFISNNTTHSFRITAKLQIFCLVSFFTFVASLLYFILSGYGYIKIATNKAEDYLIVKQVNSVLSSQIGEVMNDISYIKSHLSFEEQDDSEYKLTGAYKNYTNNKTILSYNQERQLKELGFNTSLEVNNFNILNFSTSFMGMRIRLLQERMLNISSFLETTARSSGINVARYVRRATGISNISLSSAVRIPNLRVSNISFNKRQASSFVSSSSIYERFNYLLKIKEVLSSVPHEFPIKNYRITSRYGYRMHPKYKRVLFHDGIDMVGSKSAKVLSTLHGVVRRVGVSKTYGKYVEIDHGNKVSTLYAHLKDYTVKKGEVINAWHLIGHQGNTGRSTAPHLHYEIRFNNSPVNPTLVYKMKQKTGNFM